jgi:predicted transcriptional regulator
VDFKVESGYPYEIQNPPDMVIKLSWWELSIRDIIIFSLAAYAPVLIFPVEVFFIMKIFTYLGYRKINDKMVLDNLMRLEIYSNIQKNPGITAPGIAENLGLNLGTVRYHIAVLNMTKKISSLTNPGFTAYFENDKIHSPIEKKILWYMQNKAKSQIIQYIRQSPYSSRQGIASELGISGPAITWHMHPLVEDHLILAKQDGKFVRYTINPEVSPVLEKYLTTKP